MKRNTKEVRGSTSDIISNLLENIKATVLVCLPIQDAVRTTVLSTKWRLESCPEMDQLILFLSDNGITEVETSKLVTLFGSLLVIEFLLLEYHTIRYMSAGGVPKRLPTTLNNLKTLKLLSICFAEVNEISVILCLIRSSPNLEKITIVVRRCETADVIDHVLQLLEMQDWSDVSLNRLQAVELGNLSGT
ncbi:hypothetical protein CsSME_00022056 [Camellia sinensis var. sinensis]